MYRYDNFMDQSQIDPQLDIENHIWDIIPYFDTFMVRVPRRLKRWNTRWISPLAPGTRNGLTYSPPGKRDRRSSFSYTVDGGDWERAKLFNFCIKGLADLGFACISSDYALCPKVGIPDITTASRLAVAWAYRNAESINGEAGRIFVTGHSAGGHQVGMLAITNWEDYGLPAGVIRAVFPSAGCLTCVHFDIAGCRQSCSLPAMSYSMRVRCFIFPTPDRRYWSRWERRSRWSFTGNRRNLWRRGETRGCGPTTWTSRVKTILPTYSKCFMPTARFHKRSCISPSPVDVYIT